VLTTTRRPSARHRRHLGVALFLAALATAGLAATGAAAPSAAPVNTSRPTISGTTREGATLRASTGRWTNSPTSFTYQWLRCDSAGANCAPISGATARRYTLAAGDVGHRMRVTVTARNASGSASATSNATAVVHTPGTNPVVSTRPSISGTPQEGATLTASPGTWSGAQPISFAYQWLRCDASGGACAAISGSTGQAYNTTAADVTHTLRVRVTARNNRGSNTADSDPTALIAPARGGGASISVTQVSLPQRLVVDNVKFSPQPLGSRRTLTGRFHVSDTRGFSVQGALVYAQGLPYSWARSGPEVATDDRGWATLTFRPTRSLPLRRGTALVVFVRARKPGENLLAGVSTRRLVQARVR